jgi:hypothetical protein
MGTKPYEAYISSLHEFLYPLYKKIHLFLVYPTHQAFVLMPSSIDSLKIITTTSHRAQTYPLLLFSTQRSIPRFSVLASYPDKS